MQAETMKIFLICNCGLVRAAIPMMSRIVSLKMTKTVQWAKLDCVYYLLKDLWYLNYSHTHIDNNNKIIIIIMIIFFFINKQKKKNRYINQIKH